MERSMAGGQHDALLKDFWAKHMLPAADALRKRGVTFFATGPDPRAQTYWHEHAATSNPFYEIDPARAEAELRDMWQKQGYPELANLAGPLAKLAPKLEPKKEDAGDVSPFIYVMF
jgi:hypothetical protein